MRQPAKEATAPFAYCISHLSGRYTAGREFRARRGHHVPAPPVAGTPDAQFRIEANVCRRPARESGRCLFCARQPAAMESHPAAAAIARKSWRAPYLAGPRTSQAAGCRSLSGREAEAVVVILNLPRFVAAERECWSELETM